MSEEKTAPVYYTKDFDGYSMSTDNFVANQELTVNITLNEYRELIKTAATHAVAESKANDKNYKLRRANDELNIKINQLNAKIIDLTDTLDAVTSTDKDEDDAR